MRLHIHRHRHVGSLGAYSYGECRCGHRTSWPDLHVWGVEDREWLEHRSQQLGQRPLNDPLARMRGLPPKP